MADIFVSYARKDRERIAALVRLLEQAGYSVWWDRDLTGGRDFAKDIEEHLDQAKAVLVAWSSTSVESHWVRDEAETGRAQGKLVPVMLDGTPPPMGFRQMHAIDLSQNPADSESMAALTDALDAHVGGEHQLPATRQGKSRKVSPALLALPLVAAALGIGAYFAYPSSDPENVETEDTEAPASLAILPFSMLGDQVDAYIGQGLSAKLANDLSAFPRLRIIAGTSTNAMVEQSLTAQEIGERFNISSIIEGEIRPSGETLTVSVRLVDTSTTRVLWSSEVEGRPDNFQALENDLLLEIASALQTRLGVAGAAPKQGADFDQAAYESYLRGLDAINRRGFFDPEERTRRTGYRALTRAIELEPDFADALAARAYLGLLTSPETIGVSDEVRMQRVQQDFERALELDESHLLALSANARWLIDTSGKVEDGIQILETVLERSPDYHPALYHMAIAHIVGGDHEQALAWAERLVESDPFNVAQLGILMIATFRQYDYQSYKTVLEECELCASKTRFRAYALTGLASSEECRADREEAAKDIRENMPPAFSYHYIATIDAICDETSPPQETISWLLSQNLPEIALASRFGATEEALENAGRYLEQRSSSSNLPFILVDARISFPAELRADPRYHALFETEFGRNILDYRRKHGIPDGMPLAPEDVEAEKQRMATKPFNR